MKKVTKLLKEVRQTLLVWPEARNDDVLLIREVLISYYPEFVTYGTKSLRPFLDLFNAEAVRMFSKIERCRRKVQETELLPTDWKVARKRRINEEVWRIYMSLN